MAEVVEDSLLVEMAHMVSDGEGTSRALERMDDPTAELRSKQLYEYKKLCRDLKIKEHSAIVLRFSDDERVEEPHDYDFSHTYLGDKQILPLAAALSFDRQLASLNLAHTGMRDPGLRTLCQQLKRSPRLEYMDVAGTRFSIEGAVGLLEMVKNCPRVLFVRTEDTCLQEQFALQRGLSNKYASVRLALLKIFEERVHQESGSTLKNVPAQKDSREADLQASGL